MLKNFFIIFLKFNFFMLVLYIPFVEVTFKSFEIIYLNRQFLLINVLNVFFQLFLRIPLISLNDAWRLETFIIALQICYVIVFLYLIICGIVFAFFLCAVALLQALSKKTYFKVKKNVSRLGISSCSLSQGTN